MPPSDWSPPSSSTSWPAPTGAAPPAHAVDRHRSTSSGLAIAFVSTAIGWLIVGFELFMVYVFVGREESCRANRADAYRSCVRREDITELVAEGVAIGLSAVALVVVLRSLRRHDGQRRDRTLRLTAAAAVSLMLVCVVLWVDGSRGGWEPTRPFPYDPLPNAWGHATMAMGLVIGSLAGVLVPLARRHRDADR